MKRSSFTVLVVILAIFIGWVFVAGNRLPGELMKQIESGQKQLAAAHKQISTERQTVAGEAAAAPELFQVRGFNQRWPGMFGEASAALNEADSYASTLEQLRKKNSRSSRVQVEDLLRREKERTSAALSEAQNVVDEAQKRVNLKRDFPQVLSSIDSRAKSLVAADYTPLIAKVQKAEKDWPSKKDDLQSRLDALVDAKKNAGEWEQTAKALEAKPADQLTSADYAKGLEIQEILDRNSGSAKADEVAKLSEQLYTSWDNILEDLDKEHGEYREKLKHISTTVTAPAEKGEVSSANLWRDVSPTQWQMVENDIGMTIEHKPLGKYDNEADRTPQPAGFAYMATPEQGRNQYGYWEHRDGGSFWTWLPEYLILRDLLYHRSYVPIPSYDWGRYTEAHRYGQTYYGRDVSGAPKYGSHGTFTMQHYGGSRYVQTGGFNSSKYASGGGFSGSRFGNGTAAAPSASGQRFGSSAPNSSAGRKFGSSSSGHSFGSGSRSSGRSFGGRRR